MKKETKKHIVTVKYSRQAIPTDYPFNDLDKAQQFAADKQTKNPYVRWVEIDGDTFHACPIS